MTEKAQDVNWLFGKSRILVTNKPVAQTALPASTEVRGSIDTALNIWSKHGGLWPVVLRMVILRWTSRIVTEGDNGFPGLFLFEVEAFFAIPHNYNSSPFNHFDSCSCFNWGWGFSGSSVPVVFVNQAGTVRKCIRGSPLKFTVWTFIDWRLQKSSHLLHDCCIICLILTMCRFWTRSNMASLTSKSLTAFSAGNNPLTLIIPSEKDVVPLWRLMLI